MPLRTPCTTTVDTGNAGRVDRRRLQNHVRSVETVYYEGTRLRTCRDRDLVAELIALDDQPAFHDTDQHVACQKLLGLERFKPPAQTSIALLSSNYPPFRTTMPPAKNRANARAAANRPRRYSRI